MSVIIYNVILIVLLPLNQTTLKKLILLLKINIIYATFYFILYLNLNKYFFHVFYLET